MSWGRWDVSWVQRGSCVPVLQATFVFVTLSVSSPIYAQSKTDGELQLKPIVVSDTYRSEEYHPFSFSEISQEGLAPQLFGQEPSFVLSRTPSMTFYSDSGGYQGYSYIRLRGIDQTRINFTLDGVPLNEPEDQGVYFSNYPDFLNSIERVQVVRGVGLSQNGSASYAGSINFDSHESRGDQAVTLGAGGGSFGTGRAFAEYDSAATDKVPAVYLRAAELHSDGYRRRSSNDSQSLFYKIATNDPGDTWAVSGFVGHQRNDLAWLGATQEELREDPRYNANTNEDDQFTQSLTQLRNVRKVVAAGVLTSSVYYNHLQGNYDFDLNNFFGQPSTNELYNYDFTSHFMGGYSNYKTTFGKEDTTTLTFGAHGNGYEREHRGSEALQGNLYRNKGKKTDASVFSRIEQRVGELLFMTDLQGRYTEFTYVGSAELPPTHWVFFNPKAGVTWETTKKSDVYYSIGRTGREPTRNDMLVGSDDALLDTAGVPLIGPTSPEHVVDQELGVRSRGQDWRVKANAFYMDFDQEIVLNGTIGPNGLPLTQSVERSYRTGFEGEYEWSLPRGFTAYGNATWLRARMEQGGADFTPVISPDWIANQGLEYSWQGFKLRADLRYQSSSWIDFANSTKLDSYLVTDLTAGYTVGRFSVSAHLNNVFSERYFSNGYIDYSGDARYFIQAPRSLFVTATWRL
jgi:iron complex outermembrane receptor protein